MGEQHLQVTLYFRIKSKRDPVFLLGRLIMRLGALMCGCGFDMRDYQES